MPVKGITRQCSQTTTREHLTSCDGLDWSATWHVPKKACADWECLHGFASHPICLKTIERRRISGTASLTLALKGLVGPPNNTACELTLSKVMTYVSAKLSHLYSLRSTCLNVVCSRAYIACRIHSPTLQHVCLQTFQNTFRMPRCVQDP